MLRTIIFSVASVWAGIVLAGANPLNGQPMPTPSGKKVEGAFKRDDLPPCDASGRDKYGGTDCKVVEPVLLPRDGVTDELLEKYRLKR